MKKMYRYHLLLLLTTALIAGSFVVSKSVAHLVNPISLTLLRFFGATFLLAPYILLQKKYRVEVLRVFPKASVISFFFTAYFLLFFESLKTTTALNSATLYTLVPLVTALISVPLFAHRFTIKHTVCYCVGIVGTLWVIFNGDLSDLLAFSLHQGDLFYLGAVVAMALYTVAMKFLYRGENPWLLLFCTLLSGACWMTLALFVFDQPLQCHTISGMAVVGVLYLVIVATLVTMLLYQITTVAIGPERVSAYIYLNPLFVLLIEWIFVGKVFAVAVIPGVILSAAATWLLQRE